MPLDIHFLVMLIRTSRCEWTTKNVSKRPGVVMLPAGNVDGRYDEVSNWSYAGVTTTIGAQGGRHD